MASAGKVDVTVKARVKPSIGLSTVSLGGVSLTAYALAIVAFIQGTRDEATISAIAVGTVSLLAMAAGRYGQAIAVSSLGAEKLATAVQCPPTVTRANPMPSPLPPGFAIPENDVMRDNALDPDPPAGPDPSIADPALDDPEHESVPTRAQHSGLKG